MLLLLHKSLLCWERLLLLLLWGMLRRLRQCRQRPFLAICWEPPLTAWNQDTRCLWPTSTCSSCTPTHFCPRARRWRCCCLAHHCCCAHAGWRLQLQAPPS